MEMASDRKGRPAPMAPFSKQAPSKWDKAEKWVLSPGTNRAGKVGREQPKEAVLPGCGHRLPAAKIALEVTERVDTKRIDPNGTRKEVSLERALDPAPDPYPVVDSCPKMPPFAESSVADSAISLSRHESSTSHQTSTTFVAPPSTVRAVSMRDMGTEMTPIVSQEPSRTGTPARATTPIRSPNSSRPSTPRRSVPALTPIESADCNGDHDKKELSERELKMKTRREIMLLGTQLGKMNIAAWASTEEEEKDARLDQATKSVVETRATAWEEAEKAKFLARFKREEIKIQAWKDHQEAKVEAEMRGVEVKMETMKARAHDWLMNKLTSIRHKAEGKHAAAEAKRNQRAERTAQQAEYIGRTGHIPFSFSCWCWWT